MEPERKLFQLTAEKHVGYRLRVYNLFEKDETPSPAVATFDPNPYELPPHSDPDMDKLSFYTKIYFDNYPELKAALHETGTTPPLTLDETAESRKHIPQPFLSEKSAKTEIK